MANLSDIGFAERAGIFSRFYRPGTGRGDGKERLFPATRKTDDF